MNVKSERYKFLEAVIYTLVVVVMLWMVHLLNETQHFSWNRFGLHPKSLAGIYGIFTMPFLHSGESYEHILNNSFAVAVMLTTLIYIYREISLKIVLASWLLTGLITLILGGAGTNHIGISGLTYAWVTFIFVSGLLRWDRKLMGVSLAMVVLYGSLFWGIFPIQENMSWEGHLAGAISGLILSFIYRKSPPQSSKLVYEIEEELGIEPEEKYWEEGYWDNIESKRLLEEERRSQDEEVNTSIPKFKIVYHVKPKKEH